MIGWFQTLYFVRHGESEANLLHEFSNRGLKHGLTDKGRRQAAALVHKLKEVLDMDIRPLHFIGEPIQVQFDQRPALEKKTGCPDQFVWHGETYRIVELLSEWHDYRRRGRMALNMRPSHAAAAQRRGSWGVGRDYYRVRTDSGRVFDLYYDRAPKSAGDRKGVWILYREMAIEEGTG